MAAGEPLGVFIFNGDSKPLKLNYAATADVNRNPLTGAVTTTA